MHYLTLKKPLTLSNPFFLIFSLLLGLTLPQKVIAKRALPQEAKQPTASHPLLNLPVIIPATIQKPPSSLTTTHAIQKKVITVQSGDTLSKIFQRQGLSLHTLYAILDSAPEAKRLERLKIGQKLTFILDNKEDQLLSLSTPLGKLDTLHISRAADGRYQLKQQQVKAQIRPTHTAGIITHNLSAAAQAAGLDTPLIQQLSELFAHKINLTQDLQSGDRFEVLYEKKFLNGTVIGSGAILAARLINRGQSYTAIRHQHRDGNVQYYTAEGQSLSPGFLLSPIPNARISSGFSLARRHPILNQIRPHKGIDYAAPQGTPIHSTGDGEVILTGRKGGYGKTVIIQHDGRYQTRYAHLHNFAKGIRPGTKVKQGQVIGYVGSTGMSTGPHLHYEFLVDGHQINPLSQKVPRAVALDTIERKRFHLHSRQLLAQLTKETATMLALKQE